MRGSLVVVAASVLAIVDAVLSAYIVFYAPFPLIVKIGSPTAYLNIYIHVPMAWSSYLLFTGALVSAILYLVRGREVYDRLVYGFAFTGVAYAIVTTASGSMWASESWGSPWNWDPRETGIVLLLLAYLVYFAIRASIQDPDRASRLSAVYAVAAYATVPISFLAPSLVGGLHPTPQATRPFFTQPGVLPLFLSKLVLASAVALLLAYIAARPSIARRSKLLVLAGTATLLIGSIAALLLLQPYYSSTPLRVINATMANGAIRAIGLENGTLYIFKTPVESPIQPPLVNTSSGLVPTIVGHIVAISGNSLQVVVHWSVAGNIALYTGLIGVLLIYFGLRKK